MSIVHPWINLLIYLLTFSFEKKQNTLGRQIVYETNFCDFQEFSKNLNPREKIHR